MPHCFGYSKRALLRFGPMLAVLTLPHNAEAGTITHKHIGADEGEEITLKGDIDASDVAVFRNLTLRYKEATVVLDSNGGMLAPAIEIGKIIRIAGYDTTVPYDGTCASACALVWLAGKSRWVSDHGRVGFHAGYRTTNGKPEESGVANALIGNYMTLLGLPTKAVLFATMAGPNEIAWLKPDLKDKTGIDFGTVPTIETVQAPPAVRITPLAPVRNASAIGAGSATGAPLPANSTRPAGSGVSYPMSSGENLTIFSGERNADGGIQFEARYKWMRISFSLNRALSEITIDDYPGYKKSGWGDFRGLIPGKDYGFEKITPKNIGAVFDEYFKKDAWMGYSHSDSGSFYAFNLNEMRRSGSYVSIWIRIDAARDKSVKWRTRKALMQINCPAKTIGVRSSLDYDPAGNVISSFDGENALSPIVPDSVGGDLWEALCSN